MIVGAGPAGLLLGLRLAKENIDVTLVDMGHELDTQPRATHYASPAVQEFPHISVAAIQKQLLQIQPDDDPRVNIDSL